MLPRHFSTKSRLPLPNFLRQMGCRQPPLHVIAGPRAVRCCFKPSESDCTRENALELTKIEERYDLHKVKQVKKALFNLKNYLQCFLIRRISTGENISENV